MTANNHNSETSSTTIDGTRVSYKKSGGGEPSIVFLNGHRTPMSKWNIDISKLENVGTVLAYDRFDTGGSGKSSSPQNGKAIVSTLNSLLETLEIKPPYVLVAHSLGGLYANLFARYYPTKVGAIVMVDAGHPSEADQHAIKFKTKPGLIAKLFTPVFKKDLNSEFNGVAQTVVQINNAGDFPDTFVVVVTGGMKLPFVPKDAFESHQQWQKDLAKLGTSGYQVIAEKSAHAPQVSEPELVVKAIADAIDAIQSSSTNLAT